MHFDAEFWDFIAFVVFVGLLGYFGLHKKIAGALDARSARVKAQLDEAISLRKEAEDLLASFVEKKKQAEEEAKAIIAQAQVEAEIIAKEAHVRVADFVQRRTKQAEDKIASAETQALAQVRNAATDAAAKASEIVLKSQAQGAYGDELVEQGIAGLKRLLH
ncbi:MAG: ATP F0F1 synthase subunit B [Methylovirgula sp.]|nr:ATP F0F1 synthase subunit B [Methylovirgula sp.]